MHSQDVLVLVRIIHPLRMVPIALAVLATLWVSPAAIADAPMDDGELDHITASGQPAVVAVGSNSSVTFTPATDIEQVIAPFSQAGLRALVLNNVAGENQVANGMNVSGAAASGEQTNGLKQSWGSINETTAVVVPSATAVADVSCNGALICKATPAVAVVPGTIRVLASTGDQVLSGGGGSSFLYAPATNIAMKIDSNSQTNMVALVVNNVTGLNQVGNAINIHGNGVNLTGDSLVVGGGSGQAGGQNNVISQYRGTPANFNRCASGC